MSKLKTIAIFFALAVLTSAVIFTPFILSEQSEDKILNRTLYRNCTITNKVHITAKDIALLYYNHEIMIGNADFVYQDQNGQDKAAIIQSTAELFETAFNKNDQFLAKLKTLINENSIFCTRHSILTKINNQPIALSFLQLIIDAKGEYVEVIFEEKTKTIINFQYQNVNDLEMLKNENDFDNTHLAIKNYYETNLDLSSKNYYFFCKDIKDQESEYEIYINFGIVQSEIKEEMTFTIPQETT